MKMNRTDFVITAIIFALGIGYVHFGLRDFTVATIAACLVGGILNALFLKWVFEKVATPAFKRVSDKLLQQTIVQINAGDEVIHQGGANLLSGKIAVGGKLVLTDKQLIFKPHKFNLSARERRMELTKIKNAKVEKVYQNYDGLAIETADSTAFKYIVFGPAPLEWATEIERRR